jgi:hypothetical protein
MKNKLILLILVVISSCNYKNSCEEQLKSMRDSLLLGWDYIHGELLFPDVSDSSQIAYSDSTKLHVCFKQNDTLYICSHNKNFWINNKCNFWDLDSLIQNFPQWNLELDTCVNLPRYASFKLGRDTMFYMRDHVWTPGLWVLTHAHLSKYNQKIFNLHIGQNILDVLESICAKSFFSDEIKHLIISNYIDDRRYYVFQSELYRDIPIRRQPYIIHIKIQDLMVAEIRIGDVLNKNGEIVDCEYYII